MNPQQKAASIITSYCDLTFLNDKEQIRKCAFIAADIALRSIEQTEENKSLYYYWQQVKEEIIKL